MIIWLMRNAGLGVRFVLTAVIILWFVVMTLVVFSFNDAMTRRVDAQFFALQQDHREMRETLNRSLLRFNQTIQRNTDQAKENSEILKQIP